MDFSFTGKLDSSVSLPEAATAGASLQMNSARTALFKAVKTHDTLENRVWVFQSALIHGDQDWSKSSRRAILLLFHHFLKQFPDAVLNLSKDEVRALFELAFVSHTSKDIHSGLIIRSGSMH